MKSLNEREEVWRKMRKDKNMYKRIRFRTEKRRTYMKAGP